MKRTLWRALVVTTLISSLLSVLPASAERPAPDGPVPATGQTEVVPLVRQSVKPIDQPSTKDLQRMRARQRLLEAGQTAEASALAQTGTDRVLVILVEFTGTDVFTWTAPTNPLTPTTGSTWDPLGLVDPNEYTGVAGDCSNIITQTKQFTYTGPVHNAIPRPLSPTDRSGDSIWTEDFSKQWFTDFMFGNGVVISYTMQDATPVHESFTGQSVKDFYSDLSSGVYTITGDVVGWLPLAHSTWWYAADPCPGRRSGGDVAHGGGITDQPAGDYDSLVREALNGVNAISNTIPGFNWANYDIDGDGIIDRLWIVHAGYGEEDADVLLNRMPVSGTHYGEAAVWSHSGGISTYSVTQNIAATNYIIMPENGGIGVFAHEYGHNLGADDLYSYGDAETSAGFWTTMADDWTGHPIGFEPPAQDPWHLDNWGWLNPFVLTDTAKVYTVTLGQASRFATNTATPPVYRGAKIQLADQIFDLPVAPLGSYQWWGGNSNQTNAMMTTQTPIAIPSAGVTLVFSTAYGLETAWDFLWVQASTNSGTTWNTLTNTHTSCVHDPSWIGGQNGFPVDLCGAGLGGFTDYNANFPDYDTETFSLSKFAGQSVLLRFWYMTDWGTLYEGPFVDNVKVMSGTTALFSDNAESGDANWNYAAPWGRYGASYPVSHNFYLQWRNVNANGGYDSALGDPRWRFGPANTGLLVWYNNNAYVSNDVWNPNSGYNTLNDYPGFGPKARMLVVDSHPDPYREPAVVADGYNNEAGNVAHRSLMRDAPFTLQDTVDFTYTTVYAYAYTTTLFTTHFAGRPAVSAFHDALGYYPGAENVPGGPVGQTTPRWMTKQWDASVVVPSKEFYGIKAPGYTDGTRFRFECSHNAAGQVLCYSYATGLGYDGTTGNPGDVNGQYGWHVQLINEATDHTWATVKVWNVDVGKTVGPAPADITAPGTYWFTYTVALDNMGIVADPVNVTMTLPAGLNFVSATPASGSTMLPPGGTASIDRQFIWSGYSLSAGTTVTFTLIATTTVKAGDPLKTWIASADVDDGANPVSHDTWTTTASLFAPGVEAVGGATKVGVPGGSVVHTVQIVNTGYTTDTFQVEAVTQPGVWFTAIAPGGVGMQEATAGPISIGPLGPDQRQDVMVFVYVPIDATPGARATTTLSATSAADPTKTASLTLTTSTRFKVYLPVVMK